MHHGSVLKLTSNNNLGAVCPPMLQALYNSVVERAKPIEAVNVDGGRFIREAKVRLMSCIWLVCVLFDQCVYAHLKPCQQYSVDFVMSARVPANFCIPFDKGMTILLQFQTFN